MSPARAALPAVLLCSFAAANGASPEKPGAEARLEECLLKNLSVKDRWAADYAVLLSGRYQKLAADMAPGGEDRARRVESLLRACRSPKNRVKGGLVKLGPGAWPRLRDNGGLAELRRAAERGLKVIADGSPRAFGGGHQARPADLKRTLRRLLELLEDSPDPEVLEKRLRRSFDLYRSEGAYGTKEVLYTAYALPMFEGSLKPAGPYRHPVYALPTAEAAALKKRSRAEIYAGALDGRGLELAYLKDPLDAFLIEVQGSGTLKLREGGYLRLRYAGKNGRPYTSLGKELVREGKIPHWAISIGAIRAHFRKHPDRLMSYLKRNESFVFFEGERAAEPSRRPDLIGRRSIASDKAFFPKGGLAFVDTAYPDPGGDGFVPFRRLVVDLDTGGAIKGPGHIDIFFGEDPDAFKVAGTLRHPGRLYYLLIKGAKRSPAGR